MSDIPRTALERVLARASELQTTTPETAEAISEERLLEIAREVGLDLAHVKQAIAEERARLPLAEPDTGPLLEAIGPSSVSAQRTVPGTPVEIHAKLDAWMSRVESLTTRRRIGDRQSWEPRRDFVGNALRSLGVGGGRFDLVRADQVTASVTAVDAARSVVRFDVETSVMRRDQRSGVIALLVVLGLMAAVVLVPLVVLLPTSGGVAVASMGVLGFVGGLGTLAWRALRRGYRRSLDRMHLRLEQLLDELEHERMKPPASLFNQVTGALLGQVGGRP